MVEQVRGRLREPESQLPHASVSFSVAFAVQPGVLLQALQAPQVPQPQLASQLRACVRSSPQVPQLSGSDSWSPVAHTPSSLHTSASQ
jgi:hypothetical protein